MQSTRQLSDPIHPDPIYSSTLWSNLLVNSLSIPALLVPIFAICVSLLPNFSKTSSQDYSLLFSSSTTHTLSLYPHNAVGKMTPT